MAQVDSRLKEVDALRGVAALAVVLFHLTTQFERLYKPAETASLSFVHGHYGVNLFFVISGFVIFMTLERTRTAGDFLVSRFSRLFPAYWVAVLLTFTITHALGLPGKLVSAGNALANALMFHGLFRVPHVDGVYWTLEVELLFYCGMLALFVWGQLHRVFTIVAGFLLLRWVYFGCQLWWQVDLPFILWRLLILQYLPWFTLGLAAYALTRTGPAPHKGPALAALALALTTLGVTESLASAALGGAFFTLVLLAARSRLALLRLPVLVWLGTISYPLYLLHENISWSLMLKMHALGWPADAIAILALIGALALAHGVTKWVEQPAMRWIRQRWRSRHAATRAGHVS